MRILIRTTVLPLFALGMLVSMSGKALAQKEKAPEVTDQELEEFVEVEHALRDIRRKKQKEVMNIYQNSSLGVKGYRRVASSLDNPDRKVSKSEKKEFNRIQKKIRKVKKDFQKKEKAKIKEMGMTQSEYKQVQKVLRNDQQVRKRVLRIRKAKREEIQEQNKN